MLRRFEIGIDKSAGKDCCWPWKKARTPKGYGLIGDKRKLLYTHRVSFEIHNGPIPECEERCHKKLCPICREVLHTCDNPTCGNPYHLFVGTNAENVADSIAKGRNSRPPIHFGESNFNSKLTIDDVLKIRAMYRPRECTYDHIAEMFGISHDAAQKVVRRKTWKHI